MRKNVVFRVDSSLTIGSGHVMRCITLANKLKECIELACTFITRDHDSNFNDIIIRNGFKVILLENSTLDKHLDNYSEWLGTSQDNDAAQTLAAIKSNGVENIDVLVIDPWIFNGSGGLGIFRPSLW